MSITAVIKIGGSISRGEGLPALCREIAALSRNHSLLIIPGGGEFADQVRAADRRFGLDQTAAHKMALLAMDQYGYILNHLIKGSRLCTKLDSACSIALSGEGALLLPAALVRQEDPLPHSWLVTSDSIAAWIAIRIGCPRLILIKDVDGLLSSGGLISGLTTEQLHAHSGGVDEYLPVILGKSRLETWVINGNCPERLCELLASNETKGTRIVPA